MESKMDLFKANKNTYCNYIELKTETEASNFQKKVYGEYCNQYNNEREKVKNYHYKYRHFSAGIPIEAYLGNKFESINSYMRGYSTPTDVQKYEFDMLIDRVNELILLAPTLPENIVVYRAVTEKAFKQIMLQAKKRYEYIEKGFLSTSLLLETVLNKFSPEIIMKIYVPKEAHVLGVDGIENRNENEMLFTENQRLKFITCANNINRKIYEFELETHDLGW
jgi:hypothetical protein